MKLISDTSTNRVIDILRQRVQYGAASLVGKKIHSIRAGALVVCLAPKIVRGDVEPVTMGIVEWYKQLGPQVKALPSSVTARSLTTWPRPTSPPSSSSIVWGM